METSKSLQKPSLHLKIGEVPQYPFLKQPFEVAVHLIEDNGQFKCGEEIELNAQLFFDEKPLRECPDNIVEFENQDGPIIMPSSGSTCLRMKFLDLSMRYENKSFVLKLTAQRDINGMSITPAISEPMYSVKHRLYIENSAIPLVWYKDEGGRDKCIELHVSLKDSINDIIVARTVPLKVTLLYDSKQPVVRQDILKINPENKLVIDGGKALLRIRIEDVSKNHQKQSFAVQVAPDTMKHPTNSDISPAISAAIEIRSKRNKRSRDSVQSSYHPATIQRTSADSFHSAPNNTSTRSPRNLLGKSQFADSFISPSPSSSQPSHPAGGGSGTPQEAMSTLVEWMTSTIETVRSLQWRHIGTESLNNGETRPLFIMSNPNAAIADVIQRYNECAVPNATYLLNVFQAQDKHSQTHTTSANTQHSHPIVHRTAGNNGQRDRSDSFNLALQGLSKLSSQSVPNAENKSDGRISSTATSMCGTGSIGHQVPSSADCHTFIEDKSQENNYSSAPNSTGNQSSTRDSVPVPCRSREESDFNLPSMPPENPQLARWTTSEMITTLKDTLMGDDDGDMISPNGIYVLLTKQLKPNKSDDSFPIGCLAYDSSLKLMGFVEDMSRKDTVNSQISSEIVFRSMNEYPCRDLTSSQVQYVEELLRRILDSLDRRDVVYRDDYESESRLFEEALIRLYANKDAVTLCV